MCSGRVDPEFVFRALSNGMDGVFIGGCLLGECNYTTHGNYQALNMALLCKKIIERIGLNPDRLRIEFMSSGDGMAFVDSVNTFVRQIKELGPIGEAEGIAGDELATREKNWRLVLKEKRTMGDFIPRVRLKSCLAK
jgi:F420-non-reducing hydrogenase iron-sulfur subunit